MKKQEVWELEDKLGLVYQDLAESNFHLQETMKDILGLVKDFELKIKRKKLKKLKK